MRVGEPRQAICRRHQEAEREAFYWDDELSGFGLLTNVEMKRKVHSLDREAQQVATERPYAPCAQNRSKHCYPSIERAAAYASSLASCQRLHNIDKDSILTILHAVARDKLR